MGVVADRLRRRIRTEGPVPFAVFMDEALYGEGGYYNREDLAIGTDGDFVTGSSLTPLFGRLTARLLERLDPLLGTPATLLEAGYGSGRHLEAVSESLSETTRRLIGWDRVARSLPHRVEQLNGIDDLGDRIDGVVFSYELFDALPVHRLVGLKEGRIGELWVALDSADRFVWQKGDLSDVALQRLVGEVRLQAGQIADLAPAAAPLYSSLAGRVNRGLVVTCDYGYERAALLDSRVRGNGTLACYRRHRVHRDALRHPGEQDLTAHVDFTALRTAGESLGFETVALTRQALWLTALGIFDETRDADLAQRQQVGALLDPQGMGEEIRVLVQSKGIDVGSVLDLELLTGGTA